MAVSSKIWEKLQDPDFKIWNFGIENRNAEAIARGEDVKPFDLVILINNEPVERVQECNINIAEGAEVGLEIELKFVAVRVNDKGKYEFDSYTFKIGLSILHGSSVELVEKTENIHGG